METREVVMRWRGQIGQFFLDETPEISLEGGLSSGKTTACLWKVHNSLITKPGIHWWIGRYGDGETQTKVRPAFEQVCKTVGGIPAWNAKELCYDFPNGSKCYSYGLKSPDALSRYSKVRGMGVSGIYLDQTEELPEDFSLELRLRLRQPGFKHQLIFSPNPPNTTHWLAQQFPEDNRLPNRKYYAISLYDNAHNLQPELIAAAQEAFPDTHAKHRSVILGRRGMNVTGEPVYKGAFQRPIHEVSIDYDPKLMLEMALDFGKHHPCAIFRQVSPLGQVRFLGGIFGQNLYLDDFLDIVLSHRQQWFPSPIGIKECCDPAGAADTSHGTQGALKTLWAKGIKPVYVPDSNSPQIRLAMVERMAAQMRKRAADRNEAFVVNADSDRWLIISEKVTVPDRFLADGFEAGYVWDEHMVSVNNKQVRRPKKDGWYEHGQNCFSGDVRVVTREGLVPIVDLCGRASVEVLSRSGAWVIAFGARRTRQDAPMVRVSFSDGSTVTCTPDHRFLTPRGWVQARSMAFEQCYNGVWQANQSAHVLWCLKARGIGALARIISAWGSGSTVPYGSLQTAPSLSDTTFTTATTIRTTIVLRILNVLRGSTTLATTASSRKANVLPVTLSSPAERGTAHQRVKRGIGTIMRLIQNQRGVGDSPDFVPIVVSRFNVPALLHLSRACFVLRIAAQRIARRAVWTLKNAYAWCVATGFWWTVTHGLGHADLPAKPSCLVECVAVDDAPSADAYCLDVPAVHAFCVEGGVVTHNCAEYLEANFGASPPRSKTVVSSGPRPVSGEAGWMA